MFVISRHQSWCLRNRTSTQTTTATSASTYSTMAARLPIVSFYRVTDLLASPTTSHHCPPPNSGDKADSKGAKTDGEVQEPGDVSNCLSVTWG
jgi:hypothetical protein